MIAFDLFFFILFQSGRVIPAAADGGQTHLYSVTFFHERGAVGNQRFPSSERGCDPPVAVTQSA